MTTTATGIDRPDWLDRRAWPHDLRAVAFGDLTLSVTDTGGTHDRPALLLVHAGFWSFVWRDLLGALGDRWRCVTLDVPGSGLSSGSPTGDLARAAAAVTAVVEALDLSEIVLVVHDLGGPVALHAAHAWTDRIVGLVAINTFGWRPEGAAFRTMLGVMGSAPVRELDVLSGWLPRLSSGRFGVGRHWDRRTRAAFRRGVDRRGRRSFHRSMAAVRRFGFERVDEVVRRLGAVPTLTVFGERNDPLGFAPRWAGAAADLEALTVPGGLHFPMCDAPDAVATAIERRFGTSAPQASTRLMTPSA